AQPQAGAPATGPAKARPRLELTTASGTQTIPLDILPLTIGREQTNMVVLEDKRVSRHHAQIRAQDEQIVLADLRSSNGTFVNGERIAERALHNGDTVSFGGLSMTFKQGSFRCVTMGRGQPRNIRGCPRPIAALRKG